MNEAPLRAAVHARHRPDCRFWVASAGRWESVAPVGGVLHHLDGRPVAAAQLKAFAVAYPDGQILDGEFSQLDPPEGTRFLAPDGILDDCRIPVAKLLGPTSILRVDYGACDSRPSDPDYYSTSVTNVGSEPVSVESFSPASLTSLFGFRRRLHTGRRYSSDEFTNWYAAPDARIDPGMTVTDFCNWGAPPIGWVYRGRLASGAPLLAGAILREPIQSRVKQRRSMQGA